MYTTQSARKGRETKIEFLVKAAVQDLIVETDRGRGRERERNNAPADENRAETISRYNVIDTMKRSKKLESIISSLTL